MRRAGIVVASMIWLFAPRLAAAPRAEPAKSACFAPLVNALRRLSPEPHIAVDGGVPCFVCAAMLADLRQLPERRSARHTCKLFWSKPLTWMMVEIN